MSDLLATNEGGHGACALVELGHFQAREVARLLKQACQGIDAAFVWETIDVAFGLLGDF